MRQNHTFATSIAINAEGNAYLTGFLDGRVSSFPTTSGAAQTTAAAGFVTEFNTTGTGLIFSTFIGGSGATYGNGIAVDPNTGNVYVAGTTASGFPTTSGAYQTSYGGGSTDGFVTELNPTGTTFVYSTYLGSSGTDAINAIAEDRQGNVYLTGSTTGSFPTTSGAAQTSYGGGTDAFAAKLNSTGTTLTYASYLGGSYSDIGYGIAVDNLGNATVVGATQSSDFPTNNSLYSFGGATAAFATELNPTATTFSYSSIFAGTGSMDDSEARAVALDPEGSAYVVGFTNSTNYPTTTPIYQSFNNGGYDAFAMKVIPTPAAPIFTAITTDTSSGLEITTDQNIHLLGISAPYATITLSRSDVGVLGTTTANGSGVWNFDYTATTLPEGTYAFTATATVSGQTSPSTADYLVAIDLTAPAITLVGSFDDGQPQAPSARHGQRSQWLARWHQRFREGVRFDRHHIAVDHHGHPHGRYGGDHHRHVPVAEHDL